MRENKMQLVNMKELNNNEYNFYKPIEPLQIFHSMIAVEDMENCVIGLSTGQDLQEMMPVIDDYLVWLTMCEKMHC